MATAKTKTKTTATELEDQVKDLIRSLKKPFLLDYTTPTTLRAQNRLEGELRRLEEAIRTFRAEQVEELKRQNLDGINSTRQLHGLAPLDP